MDFSGRANAVDLKTFLQCYGSALPIAVNIVEGYFGPDVDDTLEADQLLLIYKVRKEKMIVAIDQFNRELCVPKNSKTKLQLLPSGYHSSKHCSMRELCTGYQTKYFRVLKDIPSVGINSETTLILLESEQLHSNHVKCLVSDIDCYKEVLLPLELSGTFQPLLNASEYHLEEVMADYPLPVSVRFVSQNEVNVEGYIKLLSSLGNIHLMGERQVEIVFAASVENHFSLSVFPTTLDIKVGCQFKLTAKTSNKIQKCREHLAASDEALNRLDRLKAKSYYFTAYPVMHFNLELLQSYPSLSKPNKTENKTFITNGTTKGFCVDAKLETECGYVRSGSSSRCSSADEKEYQNFEIEKKMKDEMSKTDEEAPDAVFNLHKMFHNARSTPSPRDATQHTMSCNGRNHVVYDVTEGSHSPARRRPIPTPRKRLGTGNEAPGDNFNNFVDPSPKTQACHFRESNENSELSLQCRNSSKDDSDDYCPELPPKPESLRKTSPPPPLPPRGPPCGEGLAYLVTDVTDWRGVEERHLKTERQSAAMKRQALDSSDDDDEYTEVKDDGRVFRLDNLEPTNQFLNHSVKTEEFIYMNNQRGQETNLEHFQEESYLEPVDMWVAEDAPVPKQEKTERARNVTTDGDIERESSRRDIQKKNTFPQKAEGTDSSAKNSGCKHSQTCGFPAAKLREIPSRQQNQDNIIISPPREDDFMDFADIQRHFDRLKELHEAQ